MIVDSYEWSSGSGSQVFGISQTFAFPPDMTDQPTVQPSTTAAGINNLGEVVGNYFQTWVNGDVVVYEQHGFIWTQSGGYVQLDAPGAQDTALWSINDAEWILGSIVGADGNQHCVLIKPVNGGYSSLSSFTQFDEPGGDCQGGGLNGIGQIAGVYSNADGSPAPFYDDAESGPPGQNEIDLPTTGSTYATGINNNGLIVGYDAAAAILITPTQYVVVDSDPSAWFSGINDDFEMVGADSNGGLFADTPH